MSLLPRRNPLVLAWLASAIFFSAIRSVESAEPPPLHQKINSLLQQTQSAPIAEPVDDATFLRRIYLDLVGRIPAVSEVRSFLADEDSNKRAVAIDELLSRDEFNQHMAVTFDIMLMERRGGKHVKTDEFRKYLEDSFKQDKSYLQLTQEILAADGTKEKNRPAAAFYLERGVAPDLLTREIGRVFFGVDLQCAQCHNHPNIDDYHQEDYYGLKAFIVRSSLFQPDKKKPAVIAEKAEGEASFQSVFTDRASMTGPRILDGEELAEVSFKPGERYQVAPAKNVRPIPKESRLAKLAKATTSQPTDAFNRNIANRLWAQMLGRGLVHPVDLHHSANPPSHPELLRLLSEDFAARNYDVKSFLREIALSEVYQRDSTLQVKVVPIEETRKQIATLEAQAEKQLKLSYTADEVVTSATEKLDAAFAELKPLHAAIEKAHKAVAAAIKVRDAAKVKVDKASKAAIEKQKIYQWVAKANDQTKLATAALKADKELASAAAILLKKKDALNAELLKLQAAEKKEKEALANAEGTLKATGPTSDAAVAAAVPVEKKVRDLRTELIKKRQVAANYREAAATATAQASELKTLVEYSELQAKIDHLVKHIPQLTQQLQQDKALLPELVKEMAAKQAVLTAAQQSVQKTTAIVQATTSKLQKEKATSALLTESLQKLSAAAKEIGGENPLSSAKSEITAAIDELKKKDALTQSELVKQQAQLKTETASATAAGTAFKVSQQKHAAQQQKIVKLESELKQSQSELEKSKASQQSLEKTILVQSSDRLNAAEIVQLTPEQLGWSVLVATGYPGRVRIGAAAKLKKAKPLTEEDLKDPAKVAAREHEIDEATRKILTSRMKSFQSLFGASAGQPQHNFFATADQALFFSNGNEIRGWLAPAPGNLTDRLNKISDGKEFSKELYLSVLCRYPTADETKTVNDYLQLRTEAKPAAVQELAWSLLTSAEFRFEF